MSSPDNPLAVRPRGPCRRRLRRTGGTCVDPGPEESAKLLLRSGSRVAPIAGVPRPADERILGHVGVDLLQGPVAVAGGILDLATDLAERLALPGHLARG